MASTILARFDVLKDNIETLFKKRGHNIFFQNRAGAHRQMDFI